MVRGVHYSVARFNNNYKGGPIQHSKSDNYVVKDYR